MKTIPPDLDDIMAAIEDPRPFSEQSRTELLLTAADQAREIALLVARVRTLEAVLLELHHGWGVNHTSKWVRRVVVRALGGEVYTA